MKADAILKFKQITTYYIFYRYAFKVMFNTLNPYKHYR